MSEPLFKFPRTPHLVWLDKETPRGDKLLDPSESANFLSNPVTVEEKVDGTNLGLSFTVQSQLKVQNRGHWVRHGESPQYDRLWPWINSRIYDLRNILQDRYIVFGEWMFAVHTVKYTRLPDWFILFDIYDKIEKKFLDNTRRDAFAKKMRLAVPPILFQGRTDTEALLQLMSTSNYSDEKMEGIYLRVNKDGYLRARAKIVRPNFVPEGTKHWSKQSLVQNKLLNAT